MNRDIIAFIFGCSIICPHCAAKVEGQIDSEGNPPLPVHTWDDWQAESPEHCSECHEPLDLNLSKSGAVALLEEIREVVSESNKSEAAWASDMLSRFKWDLRAAGLGSEERDAIDDALDALNSANL